jgi:hypothetical protein
MDRLMIPMLTLIMTKLSANVQKSERKSRKAAETDVVLQKSDINGNNQEDGSCAAYKFWL